jgi:uncharacterized protein YfkK (UPF0435 family)
MSLLFSLFRGFIPAKIRKKHALINVTVLKGENLQDLRVDGKET